MVCFHFWQGCSPLLFLSNVFLTILVCLFFHMKFSVMPSFIKPPKSDVFLLELVILLEFIN